MTATRELQFLLSIEQAEALVTLRRRGPGASLDPEAMYGLTAAGLIEVSEFRQVVLTERGDLAYASLLRNREYPAWPNMRSPN